MKIKFVSRKEVKTSKKSNSKFQPLIEALSKLEPGGHALEITYSSEKELGSMRNIIYAFNRDHGIKVKTSKDTQNSKFYLFREH